MAKTVAKTLAKLIVGLIVIVAATWFGTSSGRAYGGAPWCAVYSIGKDAYWDCQYRTVEECVPNVIAGNRGFCNLNPWPGPTNAIVYKHQKRHVRKN
ncbi:MAG: hypothetical protein WBG18_14385 [Xanthobacteraceae bacterium]